MSPHAAPVLCVSVGCHMWQGFLGGGAQMFGILPLIKDHLFPIFSFF